MCFIMFLKKKRKYQKITEEQLKTVERVQEIREEIQGLHKDFAVTSYIGWFTEYSFDRYNFGEEYQKVLRDYIRDKIEELKEEEKNLLRGGDE